MDRIFFLLLCIALLSLPVFGQGLNALFYMEDFGGNTITNGCQPLVVQFTDSSTINGLPITYSNVNNGDPFNSHTWDFGLGLAGSNSRNPSIAYSNPDTVLVQLFVTNNAIDYDTFSRELIIHPQPIVDFTSNVQTGCDSLIVSFIDLTTSGGLPIVDWTWDFSDGVISKDTNPTHVFVLDPVTGQNCFNITLIVTNSEGCTNSLTRNMYICLDPLPIVDFSVDNRLVCDTPYTVSFTDMSVSSNGLSYSWNFGDGTSSTLQNPTHTYQNVGLYNVRLTIRDTICGKTNTVNRNSYIRTQNLKANYTFSPDSVCAGTPIRFNSSHQIASGNIVSSVWDFGDNTGTSTQLNPNYTYANGGLYTTSVTITDNLGCSNTYSIDDSILIYNRPDVSFVSDLTQSCKAPFDVQFTSTTSPDVTLYTWNFGDGTNSNQANPSHTYNNTGTFNVSLRAENTFGCIRTSTRNSLIRIEPTIVNFNVDTNSGCIPLVVQFTNNSTSNDPIIAYSWNFDDPSSGVNNTSALQNPSHTFNNIGTYNVTLTIETQTGCIGDYSLTIRAGDVANAAFNATPTTVCVKEPVSLTNTSTGNITSTLWSFGDGLFSSNPNENNHSYETPGAYDLTLRVGSNGCYSDSTIEISVLDPSADFSYNVICSSPGRVNFTSTGQGGTNFSWDFGHAGATANGITASYTYPSSGTYTVTLTVTDINTGCSDTRVQTITISLYTVDFEYNTPVNCAPSLITIINRSTPGLNYLWNFGDPASGTSNTSTSINGRHRYNNPGVYNVSLRVTDQNGCQVTETKNGFITVSDAISEFSAQQLFSCYDPNQANTINFIDQSSGVAGSYITNWKWHFGDGSVVQYNSISNPPPNPVPHTYTNPGVYDVSLVVTDNLGCSDSIMKQAFIDISNPIANFDVDYNVYCEGQEVYFRNQSVGRSASFLWDFGDQGITSTIRSPRYTFSDTGTYTIGLTVTDIYGCQDQIIKPNLIKVGTPRINFIADDTFRYCPPHLVNFSNLTAYDTLSIRSVLWDFGDGTFSRRINPSHIYTQSGFFDVGLLVEFSNGCTDSLGFENLINVGGAVGHVDLSVDTGCSPICIDLKANSSGAITHFWIYGDGTQENGRDSMNHCFLNPGLFVPAVVLTDTQQPTCTYVLYARDTLKVDSVKAYFTNGLDTVCEREPFAFYDSSFGIYNNEIVSWMWDFGDGMHDTVQNPIHSFGNSGLNTVTLIAFNGYGCSDIYSKGIFVRDKAEANFTFTDSIGCDTLFTSVIDQSVEGDAPIIDWLWDFELHGIFNVQAPPAVTYNDTGTYRISLYVTDANGCIDTATKYLTIHPRPLGISGFDTFQLCYGDTVMLQGTPGYSTYEWSPGMRLSDSTIANPLAFPQDTITYRLITTDSSTCFTVDSITIEVMPRPDLYISPYPDTTICLGDTVNLIANGSATSYNWQPRIDISNGLISNPYVYPKESITYFVLAVDSNNCKNYDSVRVKVNLFDKHISAPRTCLGDITFIADSTQTTEVPILNWNWTIDNIKFTNPLSFSDSNFTYQFIDSGNYQIDLIIRDAIGCTDTLSKTLVIDHPTQAFAEKDTIICYGASANLSASGGAEVVWTPSVFIDDSTSFNPIVRPEESTVYIANLKNGVCAIGKDSVLVTVIPTPLLEVPGDKEVIRGTSVEIEISAENYDSISWVPSESLTCSDCLVTRASPDFDTTYTVMVIDSFGCYVEKQVRVEVVEKCDEDIIFVANTFTPNDDGRNDKVFARSYGASELLYFRIFDRWGKLVFETTDSNTGWDGLSVNGKKHNKGVYVYILEAVCYNGQTIVKTGNITLLK